MPDLTDFASPPLLPLVVFLAELAVVTLGTLRIIFLARGMKVLAPVLAFFEIIIWLFAIGQIMHNLSHLGCYLGFAAGFTAGNYLGIFIENKLAIGTLLVRIITHRDAGELVGRLTGADYGVTSFGGQGATGPVTIVFTVIQRKDLAAVVAIIKGFDEKAFYSVDEIQSAAAGIFPASKGRIRIPLPDLVRNLRPAA